MDSISFYSCCRCSDLGSCNISHDLFIVLLLASSPLIYPQHSCQVSFCLEPRLSLCYKHSLSSNYLEAKVQVLTGIQGYPQPGCRAPLASSFLTHPTYHLPVPGLTHTSYSWVPRSKPYSVPASQSKQLVLSLFHDAFLNQNGWLPPLQT